ncbi:MAG: very short patch repair endonuclease [Candidatus Levybacteria bacterium CG10_big_fil_rev_8_21_14_0_10_35_13]|nr:MAG: very short patch repair endonuclease [Candidatus Levybacteria bacterium CG10_big_fil_rev_8_21_14_0_10_35_13]
MDVHTKSQRSFNMSRIKSSNTALEIMFRKYIWQEGVRGFRVKNKILGKPDIYFPKKKIAVFIDGCFWHKCPIDFITPKSNVEFWNSKISENLKRDKKINKLLKEKSVTVIRLWEHEVENNISDCFLRIEEQLKTKHT